MPPLQVGAVGQEILLQAAVPCAEATAAHSASTSTLAAAACMVERGVAEDVGGPQWRAAAEAAEEARSRREKCRSPP